MKIKIKKEVKKLKINKRNGQTRLNNEKERNRTAEAQFTLRVRDVPRLATVSNECIKYEGKQSKTKRAKAHE
jgi:hypothetical protein